MENIIISIASGFISYLLLSDATDSEIGNIPDTTSLSAWKAKETSPQELASPDFGHTTGLSGQAQPLEPVLADPASEIKNTTSDKKVNLNFNE